MRWPVDVPVVVSQEFSPAHPALDFAKGFGQPVRAPVTGTVVSIGTNPNYIGGLYVIVREDHPDGWEYYTGHHSKILVSVGQRLAEGQQIAEIGKTGTATGYHTHFQVRRRRNPDGSAGQLINPHDVFNIRNPKGANMATQEQVTGWYQKWLHRAPDAGGLAHHVKNTKEEIDFANGALGEIWERVASAESQRDAANSKASQLAIERDNWRTKAETAPPLANDPKLVELAGAFNTLKKFFKE